MLAAVLTCVALLGSTSAVIATSARKPWAHEFAYRACALVCLVLLVAALASLGTKPSTVVLPIGLPWLGAHFRLDALSAAFLAVVNLGGLSASIFALGYGRHESAPQRVLPFYPFFLAAMNLVVVADDAFSFLFAWELMSVMSWALVVSHDRSPENLRAGYVYILMASFGTLCLFLAFGILAGPDGRYGFDAIRGLSLTDPKATVVLLLVLLGAGSKAGLVPVHVWLPLAHPAAPSHVSALMSGVMTKVAVYAFIRFAFDLLGPLDWRLAMLVIAVGSITALMGVLYALMQHDLKTLLAYHTVENIGIIFTALGFALAFRADGLAASAALAATAAIFHVFNHSVFKSLLFFGSGAVLNSTGERDMEKLGGLIHGMPATAVAFLIGAAAISALPPLNGFASEWMVFQSIFLSPEFSQWGLRFIAPAAGGILALSAALAAACFVKALGITFLGRARSEAAALAKETDRTSLRAMFGLATLCVVAGAVPALFVRLLAPAVAEITSAAMPASPAIALWQPIRASAVNHNSYGGLFVLLAILVATGVVALLVRATANRSLRRGATWDCGFPDPKPVTQYSASSFAEPIRRVFGTLAFAARAHVSMPKPGDMAPASLEVTLIDPVWETFYAPVSHAIGFAADRTNVLQFLTIRRYLLIVVSTLIFLLTVMAIWL